MPHLKRADTLELQLQDNLREDSLRWPHVPIFPEKPEFWVKSLFINVGTNLDFFFFLILGGPKLKGVCYLAHLLSPLH